MISNKKTQEREVSHHYTMWRPTIPYHFLTQPGKTISPFPGKSRARKQPEYPSHAHSWLLPKLSGTRTERLRGGRVKQKKELKHGSGYSVRAHSQNLSTRFCVTTVVTVTYTYPYTIAFFLLVVWRIQMTIISGKVYSLCQHYKNIQTYQNNFFSPK